MLFSKPIEIDRKLDELFKSSAGSSAKAANASIEAIPAAAKLSKAKKSRETLAKETIKKPKKADKSKDVPVGQELAKRCKQAPKESIDKKISMESTKSNKNEASPKNPKKSRLKSPSNATETLHAEPIPTASKETGKPVNQKDLVDDPEKLQRTLFVGNVPISVKTTSIAKRFKRLMGSKCTEPRLIESIRFRSVAFKQIVPREARKFAFRSSRLHEQRDTLNAYVVYKTKEAAAEGKSLNGTLFEDKHLIVDFADPSMTKDTRDTKRCIFIGNLAFDIAEEVMYLFFEPCGEIEYVRIVRDAQTNIGKGFGYVQFVDRSSVDLALKLNGKSVPSQTNEGDPNQGRPIRISRCDKKLGFKSKLGPRYVGAVGVIGAKLRLKNKRTKRKPKKSSKK